MTISRLQPAPVFLPVLLLAATLAHADLYKVKVTRVQQDVYQDELSRGLIETRGCSEHVFKSDAVLSYEAYSHGNKLLFESGTVCDVVRVHR